MSSPEKRPGDDDRHDEEPVTSQPAADQTGPGTDDETRSSENASTEAHGRDTDDPGSIRLAPIPPEGTAAPADASRVFGQPPPSSPYARMLAGKARGDRAGTPGADLGPGADAGSSPGSEPRTTLSEEEARRLRNRGRYALALGLAGLLAAFIAFPLGPILGVAAIVLGVLARRAARDAWTTVPGAKAGIVLGIVATALSTIVIVTMVVFWDEAMEYQECISGANTQTAREACYERLMERLTERLAPAGTMPR